MKFIFPKNYTFKPKFLGLIEYSTAILDVIVAITLYFLLNLFIREISLKISLFIILILPIVLISILGINKESIITVFRYMFKYVKNSKIYLYYR